MRRREAARVLLVDDQNRVLLLWHAKPGWTDHWAPPGGGIDEGESPAEAAVRELAEETGLTGITLDRPTWSWTHHFTWHGADLEQHELIFVSRQDPVPGEATHVELDGITDARWWSLEELRACPDEVWPTGLADLEIPLTPGEEPVVL